MIMPIIITITLIAAVILFVIGMQIYSDKKLAKSDDLILTRMEQLIDDLNKMNTPDEAEPPLKTQIEPPASESAKKVDWEPDDYKDLSDGLPVDVKTKFKKHNYKRFEKDELDELGELTPHQLNKIGG